MLQFLLTQISKIKTAVSSLNSKITNYNAFVSDSDSIHSNDDLNNITTPGIYYCNNKTTTNKPSGAPDYFHLIVFGLNSGTVIQMFFYLGGGMFIRGHYGTTWEPWREVKLTE